MEILVSSNKIMFWLCAFSAFSFLFAISAVPVFIIQLPPDYFLNKKRHRLPWKVRHPVIRMTLIAGKNISGAILLVVGFLLLFLPGQGLLTLLAGTMLIDFPGKFRLERFLVERPVVINSINWIRRKAGKEPIAKYSND